LPSAPSRAAGVASNWPEVVGFGRSVQHFAEKLTSPSFSGLEATEHFVSLGKTPEDILGSAPNDRVCAFFSKLLEPNGH
jgi:hypothetical protein